MPLRCPFCCLSSDKCSSFRLGEIQSFAVQPSLNAHTHTDIYIYIIYIYILYLQDLHHSIIFGRFGESYGDLSSSHIVNHREIWIGDSADKILRLPGQSEII